MAFFNIFKAIKTAYKDRGMNDEIAALEGKLEDLHTQGKLDDGVYTAAKKYEELDALIKTNKADHQQHKDYEAATLEFMKAIKGCTGLDDDTKALAEKIVAEYDEVAAIVKKPEA